MNSSSATSESHLPWAWICLALLISASLHIALQPGSLWTDEIASVKLAQQPVGLLWSDWMRRETNPPLYYTILHYWMAEIGDSDTALRWLSWFCGAGAIVVAARLAVLLGNIRAGSVAALLVAVSPGHIVYCQEIRGYALGHTLALLALLGFAEFLRTDIGHGLRRANLALYVIAASAAMYTHTLLAILPPLVSLVFLFNAIVRGRWRELVLWLAANCIILVLWAWWATITWWQVRHPSNLSWLTRPPLWLALRYVMEVYVSEGPGFIRAAVIAALGAGFLSGCAALRRGADFVLPVVAVGVPILLYLLSWATPVMLPRTVYWAQGAMAVTVAVGLMAARLGRLGTVLAAALVAVGIGGAISQHDKLEKEPWRRVVEILNAKAPGATVLAGGPHVAYLLARYCGPPQCAFHIRTLVSPGETWSAGMPRPQPILRNEVRKHTPKAAACFD